MARDENAVMYAVEQVCALYGVQVTREQSRQFNVQGAAGRWRPMFFGTWTDTSGKLTRRSGKKITNVWNKGKADFLARPRVRFDNALAQVYISVPLWIECKSLSGKQSPEQAAFQRWVESNGDIYLLLREDVRPLITWFDAHGVSKKCDDIAIAQVVTPMDASELYKLPCKWCGFPRDPEHKKPGYGCPLHLAQCNSKLIGKVWTPDLRKGAIRNAKSAASGNSGFGSERN